jgi:hypothetical protein
MVPPKKGTRATSETIEALKGERTLSGDAPDASEVDGEYFDFIEAQRVEYKGILAGQSMPEPNQPVPKMPATFEQVSLCAKGGGCRYFFRVTAPVNMKMYDATAPGGIRPAMATMRRCLVGAVKLDSDDPIVLSTMKHLGTEAPYGVQECSHWSPYTDEEMIAVNDRRMTGQRRDQEKETLAQLLLDEEASSKRQPSGPVEDPADDMEDDGPEPDLSAPSVPVDIDALRALADSKRRL